MSPLNWTAPRCHTAHSFETASTTHDLRQMLSPTTMAHSARHERQLYDIYLRKLSTSTVTSHSTQHVRQPLQCTVCLKTTDFQHFRKFSPFSETCVNPFLWLQNFPRPHTFRIQRYTSQLHFAQESSKSDRWIASTGHFCITIAEIYVWPFWFHWRLL